MTDVIDRVDGFAGRSLEALITAVHRRRLERVGWRRAYRPNGGLWAAGEPPPRPGNSLEVLIDGGEALAAIRDEIRGARSRVHITGWHLNPGFALSRDDSPTILRELLSEVAGQVEVRVLLWAGAPLPVFRPSRNDMRKVQHELCRDPRIHCALDSRERPMHCHHDKTIVIDDQVAFVGGIDLTDFGGDRLDVNEHPPRTGIGWHDAAARLRGPAVADVADHFRLRWEATTGEPLTRPDAPAPAGVVEVQVVRTVPDGMYRQLPRGDFRILEAYLRGLRSAQQFIYLENQFLWSPEILAVLRDKLRDPPSSSFRLVILLPEKPNSGGDDTRGQLRTLVEADAGAERLLACTLLAPAGAVGHPVYVHAKIGIVDDRWLTLGSANLNEHSLFNDTEVNVLTCDEELARATRRRLWAEHLQVPISNLGGDPAVTIDSLWKPIAREQADRRARGQPPTHRLSLLPGVSKRAGLLLGPLQGLMVDA